MKIQEANWVIGSPQQKQGSLIVSSLKYLNSPEQMKNDNIKYILSVLNPSYKQKFTIPEYIQSHQVIQIYDDSCQDLKSYFNTAVSFIQSKIWKGNVLVHCVSGVSRSVSIVAAYLIKNNKWKSEKALQFIKQKRPVADPNEGFIQQLKLYQLSLNIPG